MEPSPWNTTIIPDKRGASREPIWNGGLIDALGQAYCFSGNSP